MPGFNLKAARTTRGQHPDVDEDGNWHPATYLSPDQADYDFQRHWTNPAEYELFMQHLAAQQAMEHPEVQRVVGGQQFDGTPREGYQAYRKTLAEERDWVARSRGQERYVDDRDIAAMDMDEYDKCFDSNGQPREGVYYFANRSVSTDASMDYASAREMMSNR